MKKIILAVCAGIAALLMSCVDVGAPFNGGAIEQASGNEAVVYFYFPAPVVGTELSAVPIFANGMNLGEISAKTYIVRRLEPGHYALHSDTTGIDTISEFDFKPGETYFVKVWIRMGFFVSWVKIEPTLKQVALPDIEDTYLRLD